MRRFITLRDTHIRHKHPSRSALIKGVIFQGFEVFVEDDHVDGEDIEGNNKWLRNGEDFYWSGGLSQSGSANGDENEQELPPREEENEEDRSPIEPGHILDWRASLSNVHIPAAWLGEDGLGLNGLGVRIGVLDSGITHSDLEAAINRGGEKDFTGRGIEDVMGHGTGVAGIIAAFAQAEKGIVGVAPSVELFNAKVRGRSGIKVPDIIEAIQWCEGQNVDIISMSFGNVRTDHERSDELVELIQDLTRQGIVFIVAAGDGRRINQNGRDILINRTNFPANIEECISVASVKEDWWNTFISTPDLRVANSVDFIAPFQGILTTSIERISNADTGVELSDTFKEVSGSSFAVPFVTGLAALIINVFDLLNSENRQNRAQEIKNRLHEIATPLRNMSFDSPEYQAVVKTQAE